MDDRGLGARGTGMYLDLYFLNNTSANNSNPCSILGEAEYFR
jgi:hypothetical protein